MKIMNLVKLDEAPIRATANRANANAQAREQTTQQSQQQQQQQQQQGPAKHTANKAADNEATREQQPQPKESPEKEAVINSSSLQTDAAKAILQFAQENPQLIGKIKNRINRIGITESANAKNPMITEIFGLGGKKESKGLTPEQVMDKWDEAGNPRDIVGIKKFLKSIGIDDDGVTTILSNSGYKDPGDAKNERLMGLYDKLQKDFAIVRKKDKQLFASEAKTLLGALNKLGATQ